MELVVANYGQTAATNVHITIDPEPLRVVLKDSEDPDGPTSETPLHYPKTLSVLVGRPLHSVRSLCESSVSI